MNRIDIVTWSTQPFRILDQDWALLVAGVSRPNPMTVSWGGFGTIWNKPIATVFVRPTRHTFGCINESGEFTLNFLPEAYRDALSRCGTESGRDLDKWESSGLSQVGSERIAVPRVAQASLALECRVVATTNIDEGQFMDSALGGMYPAKDFHRVYFGEVLAIWGP